MTPGIDEPHTARRIREIAAVRPHDDAVIEEGVRYSYTKFAQSLAQMTAALAAGDAGNERGAANIGGTARPLHNAASPASTSTPLRKRPHIFGLPSPATQHTGPRLLPPGDLTTSACESRIRSAISA